MKYSMCIRVLLLSLLVLLSPMAQGEAERGCERFKIEDVNFKHQILRSIETDISDIKSGKLFYREASGACVPTTDTYLLVFIDGVLPRIAAVLKGHTLELDTISVDNTTYLAAYYFSGGNQYVLSLFEFEMDDLAPVKGPGLSSNIRSIVLDGSHIVVRNQVMDASGAREVLVHEYWIEDGEIVDNNMMN